MDNSRDEPVRMVGGGGGGGGGWRIAALPRQNDTLCPRCVCPYDQRNMPDII